MKTLADMNETERTAFQDAVAAALDASEIQRLAEAAGQRRPSLTELFAYAENPASVDAPAILAAIAKGGLTTCDWRQVRETLGGSALTFAAAAATEDDSISAINVGRGLRLDVKQSDVEPSIYTLVLDCRKSQHGATPRFLAIEAIDGSQYFQIELPPPYRQFVQMDLKREVALRLIAARNQPEKFVMSVW